MVYQFIGFYLRAVVGCILIVSSLYKFSDMGAFRSTLDRYQILPRAAVKPVAWLMPLVEASVGALVIVGVASPWSEFGAAVLFSSFAGAIAINLFRGRREIPCGCFGSGAGQGLSWTLVGRNIVLTLLAMFAAKAWIMGWAEGHSVAHGIAEGLPASEVSIAILAGCGSVLVWRLCDTLIGSMRLFKSV